MTVNAVKKKFFKDTELVAGAAIHGDDQRCKKKDAGLVPGAVIYGIHGDDERYKKTPGLLQVQRAGLA